MRQTFGLTDYDARAKIRKGWGFLERDTTEETAQQIVAAIGDWAGGAVAIDNVDLHIPAEPKVMTGFEVVANGFTPQLQSPQETTRLIEWSEVGIVAAGGFSEEVIRHESGGDEKTMGKMMIGLGVFMVTGVPTGIFGGGKKKKRGKAREIQPRDYFRADCHDRWRAIRLQSRSFRFRRLGREETVECYRELSGAGW